MKTWEQLIKRIVLKRSFNPRIPEVEKVLVDEELVRANEIKASIDGNKFFQRRTLHPGSACLSRKPIYIQQQETKKRLTTAHSPPDSREQTTPPCNKQFPTGPIRVARYVRKFPAMKYNA
jgi:hypothetical protein